MSEGEMWSGTTVASDSFKLCPVSAKGDIPL